MINTLVGIDPGLKGSMAFLKTKGSLVIERIPVLTETRASGKVVRRIDTERMADILRKHGADAAMVEDVWSMPRDGRRGAFTFGGTKTAVIAALEAAGVKRAAIHYETPAVWKGKMRVSSNKKTSRALAEKLFPSTKFASYDDCEAALIAAYGIIHRRLGV